MPYHFEAYEDTECTIAELEVQQLPIFRDVTGLLVSLTLSDYGPSKLYITDFTSNEQIISDFPVDDFIGSTQDRIGKDKLLQIVAYKEKLVPFFKELEAKGYGSLDGSSTHNLTGSGIFVKCKLKLKVFNRVLEGTAQNLKLVQASSFDSRKPVFKNVISNLPTSFLTHHKVNFLKTIPELYLNTWITPSSSHHFQAPSTPMGLQTPTTPALRRSELNQNLAPSLPPDSRHKSVLLPSSSSNQNGSGSGISRDHDSPFMKDIQIQPKKKQRITSSRIKTLNSLNTVDGKVFNVIGIIVEIEPLLNQFCVKPDLNSPPQFMPITIIIRGSLAHTMEDLDESYFLRISITEKSEILNFLGVTEIEEAYVRSSEIYSALVQLIKSKKQVEVNVTRKLIKINDISSMMLGWESTDMTLKKLLES